MKNKNQQIISVLKKTNLELKDLIKHGNYLHFEQEEVNSRLRKTLKESMDYLYRFQNEGRKLEAIMEEQEKEIGNLYGQDFEYQTKIAELEKELGYYRWYEQHIEQQRSDTFYDMRNGNEYRTRGGLRIQYRKEMELKEIEWRNKSNS